MPKTAATSAASGEAVGEATANGSVAASSNGHAPSHRTVQGPKAEAGTSQAGTSEAGTSGDAPPQPMRVTLLSRSLNLLRSHWIATAFLAAGLALRVLTQVSYSPALLYIDSVKYLYGAWPFADPLGYDVPLKIILAVGNLNAVEAVQHLLGLGMAVAIYVVLRRRGVPRWLSALAMAPILLDAYQLQAEATIMPDVWFEAAIVAGVVILLWKPRATLWMCVAAGVILGLSATIRQVGEIFLIPLLIFALATGGGWRQVLGRTAATAVAFIMPIFLYMSGSLYFTGHFWLSRNSYELTYGRMAAAADCATLKLPSYERPLCPTPAQQALGPDWLDHGATSPLRLYVAPPNLVRSKVIASFNNSVVTQQPLRVAGRVSSDAIKLFEMVRTTSPGDTPIYRWQFQTTYPQLAPTIQTSKQGTIILGLKLAASGGPTIYRSLDASYGGNARVWQPGATFLGSYMLDGGYTPGPLLLLTVLAGLAGSLTIFRRRASAAQRQLALGALAFFATGVAVLVMSNLFQFSWRYQMPAVVTLPPAGAFGIAAVLRYARRRRTTHAAGSAGRSERVTAGTG